jgi:hypothetical protein
MVSNSFGYRIVMSGRLVSSSHGQWPVFSKNETSAGKKAGFLASPEMTNPEQPSSRTKIPILPN